MLRNFVSELLKITTTNLAQSFVKALASNTGGGNGLFDIIGKVLSGFIGGGTTGATGFSNRGAEGGFLHGPSHASGGVHVELEGGEYVVNKKDTAKWRGLLESINKGSLDVSGFGVPKYAAGGFVGPASMTGGVNNTSININISSGGSADAKSSSGANSNLLDFGKRLSGIIQQEIVNQKRPGGLLANT